MSPCPICERAVAPRAENADYPFCSARCKLIDLGKWLNEGYRVPAGPSDDAYEDNQDPIEEKA